MNPHRVPARVHEGVVAIPGVPGSDGEVVEVIVIRSADDADRYPRAPIDGAEFSDVEDFLRRDGEGWEEFTNGVR